MLAITRDVSPSINECELTFLEREPISVERARLQHEQYENCLRGLGWKVERLPSSADLPDSVFIEDIAVVLDDVAIVTRPGADSRRGEIAAVENALRPLRRIVRIQSPGTLDGGDVLRIGNRIFIGLSERTNGDGIAQFPADVTVVPVEKCLHLKSGVSAVGPNHLLINPDWIPVEHFRDFELIECHPDEPFAANALLLRPAGHAAGVPLRDVVMVSRSFPRTRERLEGAGIRTIAVDCTELEKAEGGVTCCSLLVF